jgi:zeaxanthin glucosyltransferase
LKVAFVSVPVPGHLNPTSSLARRFQARGHDVVFASMSPTEPFAHAAGLPFLPYADNLIDSKKMRAKLSRSVGIGALSIVWSALADMLPGSIDDLFRVVKEARIDALVIDEGQFGLGVVPLHLGIPYVNISNSFHLDFTGYTPLCIFDWPHASSPEALARNRSGLEQTRFIFDPCRNAARAYAERIGLKQRIDWDDPFALISKLAWITQSPKEFDFENPQWPSQFHYTGPFHDGTGRIPTDFPWDRLTGEPLIYASLGTVQNGLESIFNTIGEAAAQYPETQLVLSIGPSLDPKSVHSLPSNALVVPYAPQQELLSRATLCITHAGLNTTLECLTHGVPMVAIPVTNDQPGNSAKIAHTKTGDFVPIQKLSVSRLSRLIGQVMADPTYRQNAMRFKKIIADTNGLEKAVDLLEKAFELSSGNNQKITQSSDKEALVLF